jgi:flagellar biosynthesis/type III secretory pathway protein FliH
MLLTEWNQDEAIEVAREEGLEEGREEGHEEVLKFFEQGLSVEEIKKRLQKESTLRR